MADSISKPFSIFRFTDGADTETLIADKEAIGMDIGISEDGLIGFTGYEPVFDSRRTDVPNPDEQGGSSPDTGQIPTRFKIMFVVNEKKTTKNLQLVRFCRFMLGDKKVDNVFSKGRFGIRYNAKDYLNVVPTLNQGMKLVSVRFNDNIFFGGMVTGEFLIDFVGDPATLLAQLDAVPDP